MGKWGGGKNGSKFLPILQVGAYLYTFVQFYDDSPSSLKVWGVHQDSYTYVNLEEWVLNHGTLDVGGKKEKGKGKQMLQEKEKDEGGSSNLKSKRHKKNKKL